MTAPCAASMESCSSTDPLRPRRRCRRWGGSRSIVARTTRVPTPMVRWHSECGACRSSTSQAGTSRSRTRMGRCGWSPTAKSTITRTLRARIGRAGTSVQDGIGLRDDSSPLRGTRRRLRAASERHVRIRTVGCAPPPIAHWSRSAGHQADLPVQRRKAAVVRERGQGHSRGARCQGGARPGRVVLLPRSGLCAGAAVDLPRHPQASAGDAAGRRRRSRRGAALLARVRGRRSTRFPRRSGSRACVRGSRNRCGCKW